jgi:hypothetical protein
MNFDEILALGFCLGCICSGLIFTLLWLCRDRAQGALNQNEDWPE